ncbi:TRAP transporter large permease subunit [Devosia oryzisoli]|uniref:TRAP transporter large permease subunit n=1 Tax=Devosia oryzisoli TaxID=2774138 RepID=UPI0020C02463|nr:TRAP transporter large permease subunit [Devosia oryzisoli]
MALTGTCQFRTRRDADWVHYSGALIPANFEHTFLAPGYLVANLFCDPESTVGRMIAGRLNARANTPLDADTTSGLAAELKESLLHTLQTCGMIIWIGLAAAVLVGVYNLMGGNRFVANAILSLDAPPVVIIMVMMLILLVLGMFLDWIGIALLTPPIFVPIVIQLGYDPIWFGILFAVNMQVFIPDAPLWARRVLPQERRAQADHP